MAVYSGKGGEGDNGEGREGREGEGSSSAMGRSAREGCTLRGDGRVICPLLGFLGLATRGSRGRGVHEWASQLSPSSSSSCTSGCNTMVRSITLGLLLCLLLLDLDDCIEKTLMVLVVEVDDPGLSSGESSNFFTWTLNI